MQTLEGLGVARGVGIGKAVCLRSRVGEVYRFPLPGEEVEAEVERFHEAVRRGQEDLKKLRSLVSKDIGDDLSAIFDAHLLLVQDGSLTNGVIQCIHDEKVNAEWAVYKTVEELSERFGRIEDEYLRERHEDLRDVGRHLIHTLQGVSHHELSEIAGDVIVVADDLTPADTVRLGRENVRGFIVETGGRTSHTTIIARSLNLPLVCGLVGVSDLVTDEDPVIVDGEQGRVILHPSETILERYRHRRQDLELEERAALATRELAAVTHDGTEIRLMANIDLPEEIDDVRRFGAAGIGLYRSEFLYIEKSPQLPDEEEHLGIYRRLVEAAAPHPAVIRTYDLGGRKLAREVMATYEDNPVLGLRGIRLTLARPEVFRTQLRALFRAAVFGDLWVMLPLVSTVEEVRRFRAFATEVCDELEREGVPIRRDPKLGVMIEVPAAAVIADQLAKEVEFFSIGTNDLIQYSLAVDRNNEHVAYLYQPLHPGILRMLHTVIQAARKEGIGVSLCGEMAADSRFAALLVGLGLRRLSVSPRVVPVIKTRLRELCAGELEEVALRCLDLSTAAEVDENLENALQRVVPG
jgi:phosphotransferase system enzyme I (PtsI)